MTFSVYWHQLSDWPQNYYNSGCCCSTFNSFLVFLLIVLPMSMSIQFSLLEKLHSDFEKCSVFLHDDSTTTTVNFINCRVHIFFHPPPEAAKSDRSGIKTELWDAAVWSLQGIIDPDQPSPSLESKTRTDRYAALPLHIHKEALCCCFCGTKLYRLDSISMMTKSLQTALSRPCKIIMNDEKENWYYNENE